MNDNFQFQLPWLLGLLALLPACAGYAWCQRALSPGAGVAGLPVAAWELRLAWHIGRRNVGHGEDPRYVTWRV